MPVIDIVNDALGTLADATYEVTVDETLAAFILAERNGQRVLDLFPGLVAARQLVSSDEDTFARADDGLIHFQVDGLPVGQVEIAGGLPKWTLDGILDPVAYAGTPRTIAQRDALVVVDPLAKAGYLVYVVDVGVAEYQVWDGTLWQPVGSSVGGATTVVETLTVVSRNTVNDLLTVPASPVEFHVNGVRVYSGISNSSQVVTIDPIALGFNIDPGVDAVTATYNTYKVAEVLVISSLNNINDLSYLPASVVEFYVNGVRTWTGISNVAQVITVDPVALGFNIAPGADIVVASYSV